MKIELTQNKFSTSHYTTLINNSDAEAQNTLGEMYFTGIGVPQHFTKALSLFEMAADQNNANALYNLAVMFYLGTGVEKSLDTAVNYLSRASELKNEKSQCAQAILFMKGEGVGLEPKKSFQLFEELANKGNETAQNYLVKQYISGMGCDENTEEAFSLLNKFSNSGNEIATLNLVTVLSDMFSEAKGIEKDSAKAVELLLGVAEKGNALAQSILSTHYNEGVGCNQDKDAASKWLNKALLQECPYAEYLKAIELYQDIDNSEVRRDREYYQQDYQYESHWSEDYEDNAMSYIYKSSLKGCKEAQLQLSKWLGEGMLYRKEKYDQAYSWSSIALASGLEKSMYEREKWGSFLSADELNKAQDAAVKTYESIVKRNKQFTQVDSEYLLELY